MPEGEMPLIVSLHGFGGDALSHADYIPLHQRVNAYGFALLLPEGVADADGHRFWNPTDGRYGEKGPMADDAAALSALVEEVSGEFPVGPVYFFGYSNGGFMAYWMACRGLPGLRAVASLAGTSYLADTECEGALPVSVLHIHGTADSVIRFEGDRAEPDPKGGGETAFYAGAPDMLERWGRRAGRHRPVNPQPYAALDLDQYVSGAETWAFRLESGCAAGIVIELWEGIGSGHSPGYGDAFADALVDWLLSQQ